MNVGTVLDFFYMLIGDSRDVPQYVTEATAMEYANEAVRDFYVRLRPVHRDAVIAIESDGYANYPTDAQDIFSCRYVGKDLDQVTSFELRTSDPEWRTRTAAEPLAFFLDTLERRIGPWPFLQIGEGDGAPSAPEGLDVEGFPTTDTRPLAPDELEVEGGGV